ncbi:capsule assembly Wzi family protein [Gilvibacter sp.]|uniref:capsule assembly Wzi family protein n=1 Tax=Gilvibacter sp. TaxID=2729997 RepID=UPI003F4A4678
MRFFQPKIKCFGALLLFSAFSFAQEYNYQATGGVRVFKSSQQNLPFWMQANTNGAVGAGTNFLVDGGLSGQLMLNNGWQLSGKASLFYRDEVPDELQRDELYAQLDTPWLSVVIGSRRNEDRFDGLGLVQDNFLLSGNARALPGLLVEAPSPQRIFKGVALDWGIGHYSLNDERFVEDVLLHFKRLAAVITLSPRTTLKAGIQHYAQWGGNSPERGKQPSGFSDFIDIFFASQGSDSASDTDRANALGNHLGIYELEVNHRTTYGNLRFYHSHPFEDGSGTRLKNFPDGIWGFYYDPNTEDYTSLFKGLVVEYFQTTDQSGATGDAGRDNYFRSGVYRSGWTYDGNILGLPFITMDETGLEIGNNRVRGIHLGLSAGRGSWLIYTKATAYENFGSFRLDNRIDPPQQILNTFVGFEYDFKKYGSVNLQAAADWGDGFRDTYGVSLGYRISIQ